MKIYNTLTGEKEIINQKKLKMFVCGPTVYDSSHLGHARTYIAYDIIARWLRRSHELFYLMNITDVDDKIIKRAKDAGKQPTEIAREFEKKFHEDLSALGIKSTDKFAPASEHITEIIYQIDRLIKKGFAYATATGVYFDISKFSNYGELSHQNPEELGKHRVEPDATKKNPQDFSLWKLQTEGISWESPWGRGRPGWHIEDTAISEKYLGQQYDIHGGGLDLVFPHHEAEIAQMESVSGKRPMVKVWTHTGFLLVNGEKMSKSLGNFVTIREALKKNDPETLRLFFSFTHYRSPIDYSERNLEQASQSLEKLYTTLHLVAEARDAKDAHIDNALRAETKEILRRFDESMNDDFNTPLALTHLFEMSSVANKRSEENGLSKESKKEITDAIKLMGSVFGILGRGAAMEIGPEAKDLIVERDIARKRGDYKRSDELRARLLEMGIEIQDTKEGTKWRKVR